MALIVGIVGFILFYVYELNQIIWHKSYLKGLFTIGFICIISSTFTTALDGWSEINFISISFWVGVFLFAIFFVLTIYTLFFSIPFTDSYISQFQYRKVYTKKMYALSRHPGVLWFIGLYSSLILIFKTQSMINLALILSILNVIYILLQDLWSFPKLFVDYKQYKNSTPFLIPSINSLFKAIQSFKGR